RHRSCTESSSYRLQSACAAIPGRWTGADRAQLHVARRRRPGRTGPQSEEMMPAPLLTIRDLHIAFTSDKKEVPAVNGVDLTIYAGQTVAIVGESGSGKSTTAHAIIDLLPDTGHVTSGSIELQGDRKSVV